MFFGRHSLSTASVRPYSRRGIVSGGMAGLGDVTAADLTPEGIRNHRAVLLARANAMRTATTNEAYVAAASRLGAELNLCGQIIARGKPSAVSQSDWDAFRTTYDGSLHTYQSQSPPTAVPTTTTTTTTRPAAPEERGVLDVITEWFTGEGATTGGIAKTATTPPGAAPAPAPAPTTTKTATPTPAPTPTAPQAGVVPTSGGVIDTITQAFQAVQQGPGTIPGVIPTEGGVMGVVRHPAFLPLVGGVSAIVLALYLTRKKTPAGEAAKKNARRRRARRRR